MERGVPSPPLTDGPLPKTEFFAEKLTERTKDKMPKCPQKFAAFYPENCVCVCVGGLGIEPIYQKNQVKLIIHNSQIGLIYS